MSETTRSSPEALRNASKPLQADMSLSPWLLIPVHHFKNGQLHRDCSNPSLAGKLDKRQLSSATAYSQTVTIGAGALGAFIPTAARGGAWLARAGFEPSPRGAIPSVRTDFFAEHTCHTYLLPSVMSLSFSSFIHLENIFPSISRYRLCSVGRWVRRAGGRVELLMWKQTEKGPPPVENLPLPVA